jgi:hypothetical protein
MQICRKRTPDQDQKYMHCCEEPGCGFQAFFPRYGYRGTRTITVCLVFQNLYAVVKQAVLSNSTGGGVQIET